MEDFEKFEIINSAASVLMLHADLMKGTLGILMSVEQLINSLDLNDKNRLQPEIEFIIQNIMVTQSQIQKTGLAQTLFMENLIDIFDLPRQHEGLKNVHRGKLKKKN
ncbi:MAG: hypothetical protein HC836_37130 [Richelia sp. RM2_1_2]|nr:hypothetical protein [Richelia sp. RM2_1_2]